VPACLSCGAENPARARFCLECGSVLVPAVEVERFRKTVTVLFCDVVESSILGERLDPETLSQVMSRYFGAARRELVKHGGSVEKFIGDAVVAVFGIPITHEDDALRAVKAAVALREALAEVNAEIDARWGVMLRARVAVVTGVVAGSADGENLVLGDTGNTAARLQQLAGSGEVLLSPATHALVRDAVEVERLPPAELRGKAERVPVYRLLRLRPQAEAVPRHFDRMLVGRQSELAEFEDACRRALRQRGCRLVSVAGPAGIGKSRLCAELVQHIGGGARVFRGRCLPYGEGITYWPLAEVVREAAAIAGQDSAAVAGEKLAALLAEADEGERIAVNVARLIGLATGAVPSGEAFWAVRRLLEHLAAEQPLMVVLDDLHWAEPTFLALVEHLLDNVTAAPVVLVALARPELFDHSWQRGVGQSTTFIALDTLAAEDAGALVDQLLGSDPLPPEPRALIGAAGAGNPLFLEQFVSKLIDDGALRHEQGRWQVAGDVTKLPIPATIEALLVGRIELLTGDEREVLSRAAVIGEAFSDQELSELVGEPVRPRVEAQLASLVRKQLLTATAQARVFRFRHMLIRDVAYERLAKADRARFHLRYADWLERRRAERTAEVAEILGYHLAESHRLAAELGSRDEETQQTATRAATWLTLAGRRAFARGDMPAAVRLLRRATSLLTDDPAKRLELLPELARALRLAGDRIGAEAVLAEALSSAAAVADRRVELLASVEQTSTRLYTDPDVDTHSALELAEQVKLAFSDPPDQGGLSAAWALIGHVNWLLCRGREMEVAFGHALEHTTEDQPEWGWIVRMLALAHFAGPTPVTAAIARCQEILRLAAGYGAVEISTRTKIAALQAMRGEFHLARDLYRHSKQIALELGLPGQLAAVSNYSGPIELLAGDLAAAERELREACDAFDALGESSTLAMSAAFLARVLERQGSLGEAEHFTSVSERSAPRNDLAPQFTWRAVRARVLARQGQIAPALQLAHEAAAVAARTDFLSYRGEVLLDLAEVLRLSGDDRASADVVRRATDLLETKGNIVLAEQARRLQGDVSRSPALTASPPRG
jgi:class 3 adenylate cyclase/tetratricopeptide (TPR) repeat protein